MLPTSCILVHMQALCLSPCLQQLIISKVILACKLLQITTRRTPCEHRSWLSAIDTVSWPLKFLLLNGRLKRASCLGICSVMAVPMRRTIKQLEQEHRILTEDIREGIRTRKRLCAELDRERKQAASKQKRALDVAFVLFVLCCPSAAAALVYVAMQLPGNAGDAELDVLASLEQRYMETPMADLLAILENTGGADASVRKTASRFLQEHQLHEWIRCQNVDKGVAPSTRLIMRHMLLSRQTSGEDTNCRRKWESEQASMKWLQRFRRRWGVTLGTFPARETLSLETMRKKVLVNIQTEHECARKKWSRIYNKQKVGAIFWTHFWVPQLQMAPNTGTVFRPQFYTYYVPNCRHSLCGTGGICSKPTCPRTNKFYG